MAGLSVSRTLASCLIPSNESKGRQKVSARSLTLLLAALMLFVGGREPVYAQGQKPVLHTSVMQPSSNPPESVQLRSAPLTMTHSNLGPVNTGAGMVYTCGSGIATSTCNYLNSTVAAYYNDTFTNANANIYVQIGSTGLGSSLQYFNFVTYSQYTTAYANIPHKGAIQTSAQSALSTYDSTPYGSDSVYVTAALGTALGFSGLTGITSSNGGCTIGTANCYNAIVTVTNNPDITLYYDDQGGTEPAGAYDFYAVVEHETDEVLGTSSCIDTQSDTGLADSCDSAAGASAGTGTPSAVDLYRYSGAGTLVLDSSLSQTAGAYFSYNGGSTDGAIGVGGTPKYYNTLDNGDDYADYVASSPNCGTNQAIQDATGCPGQDGGLTILNDGGSEINILTTVGYQVPAASSFCTTANPNPNPNPVSFANPGDYNGDCKSDILWQSSSSGQLYTWLMNGTSTLNQLSPGTVTSPWGVVGIGDFNGDGKADLLWQSSSTGQLYMWLMNGASITSQVTPGTVASPWKIVGIGDFNGDGKADILWQNTSTGQLYIWLMNGASITSQISPGTVSSPWGVVGIGDFNGDGKADILWQNSSTGQLYIWLMNGAAVTSQLSPGTVASPWSVAGIGDFDGDGKSDILWRNSSTGQLYTWFMNGASIRSQLSPGTAAPPWNIFGVGDYNGDGKADILWQNTSSGQLYIWLMNGVSITAQQSPGTVSAPWQVVEDLQP